MYVSVNLHQGKNTLRKFTKKDRFIFYLVKKLRNNCSHTMSYCIPILVVLSTIFYFQSYTINNFFFFFLSVTHEDKYVSVNFHQWQEYLERNYQQRLNHIASHEEGTIVAIQ